MTATQYREAVFAVLTDEPISPTRAAELVVASAGGRVYLGEEGRAAAGVEARNAAVWLGTRVRWERSCFALPRPLPKDAEALGCRACRAKPGEECRSEKGRTVQTHGLRLEDYADLRWRAKLGGGGRGTAASTRARAARA